MFVDQWDAAIPLVKVLVFAGAIGALWNLSSNALMALGHVNKILRGELIVQTTRAGLVFYAASISIEMTCYALVAIYVLNLFVTLRYLNQSIGLTLRQLLFSNINSLMITLISMLIPLLCFTYLPKTFSPFQEIAINGIGLLIGWLIGIFITNHPLRQELRSILSKFKVLP